MKDILNRVSDAGLILDVNEGELQVFATKEVVDENLIADIKANKIELVTYLNNSRAAFKKKDYKEIGKCETNDSYPVSDAQLRLWVIGQTEEGAVAYNMPNSIDLDGTFDIVCFEKAVLAVIDRHEILRTVFKVNESEQVRQFVLKSEDLKFSFDFKDFREEEDVNAACEAYITEDSYLPFDFVNGPLFRASLIRLKEDKYVFYYNMHHIISDGWSMDVLANDVMQYYEAYLSGTEPNLKQLKIHYKDYTHWQLNQLENKAFQDQEKYWLNRLDCEITSIDLPTQKKRPKLKTYRGLGFGARLSADTIAKLRAFTTEKGGSLFNGLLAAWKVLLYRYTQQSDIIVGNPVAGRDHPDLENQIGFYVNTLALRTQINPECNFSEFYQQVRTSTLEDYKHQMYPYNKLINKIDFVRDPGRNPLFDILIDFHGTSEHGLDLNSDQEIQAIGEVMVKFDLELHLSEVDEGVDMVFNFNSEIYEKHDIKNLIVHYKEILKSLLEQPNTCIDKVSYLTETEKTELLHGLNSTKIDYPSKSILDNYSSLVKEIPNSVQIKFEESTLTFQELDEKSNQLAHYLQSQGVTSSSMVPLIVDRSIEMLVGIVGILKTGGSYVPIDPNNPADRVAFILKDIEANILLTQKKHADLLSESETKITQVYLDEATKLLAKHSSAPLKVKIKPDQLAYVIYTSGTTGKPKGVKNNHGALLNRLYWMQEELEITQSDTLIQKTPYTFDVSVWELLMPLIAGCKLIIAQPEGHKDPHYLETLIKKEGVSIMHLVPSMLRVFLEVIDANNYESLRHVVCSGEALPYAVVNNFKDKLPGINLHNYYGPTEAAIDVTSIELTSQDLSNELISIGRPVANTEILILSDSLELLPKGAIGELCIGGVQLADGYLNRPELTSTKFIAHPFKTDEKLYLTGDLARWLPNGTIEYIGRKDHQVKINGNRVELGEIESVLDQEEGIEQSVVIARKDAQGSLHLVAYVVSEKEVNADELESILQSRLPEYMVPRLYITLKEMPLNKNGKVDRKALPDAGGAAYKKKEYIAPKSNEEKVLVAVCESVLGISEIGMKDNFYNLGGDSIKSIQLVARLRQKGYVIKVGEVLANPIFGKMTSFMSQLSRSIDQSEVNGSVLLTPIQHFFFEDSGLSKLEHFNQAIVLKSQIDLDTNVLETVFKEIVKHHDALRMTYKFDADEWKQYNESYSDDCISINSHDLRNQDDSLVAMGEICQKMHAGFELSKGPLFVVGHFKMSDGDRLVLISHHLVIDGVSWRIIMEDLLALYNAYKSNEKITLPLKTDSYQLWSSKLQEYANSKEINKEKEYWNYLHNQVIPGFPIDTNKKALGNKLDNTLGFKLDKDVTQLMQTSIHDVYNTEVNDILLTSLGLALQNVFGISKSVVNMEGHGREDIVDDLDISRTVGWFTSMFPFLLEVMEDSKLTNSLINVKDDLRKIPNKGIGYGVIKYLLKEFSSDLKPTILFNYLGDFGSNAGSNEKAPIFEYASDYIGEAIGEDVEEEILFNVSGILVEGELNMSISYNSNLFTEEQIKALTDDYKKNLTVLINELSATDTASLTRSDLTFSDLSSEEFLEINADGQLEDVYTLSPAQQGMYYHWLSSEDQFLYFIQLSYLVSGKGFNIKRVKKAFELLVERYSILRTSFTNQYAGTLLQVVRKSVPSGLGYEKMPSTVNMEDRGDWIKERKLADREKGFNLEDASQMRLTVLDIGNQEYEFIWSYHHILMDGWCTSILINEFYSILQSIETGAKLELPVAKPYSDYINWLEDVSQQDTLNYWKEYLANYTDLAKIPEVHSNQEGLQYELGNEIVDFSGELYDQIGVLCADLGVTYNTFIQTVWGYLLSKYNDTQDVVFGSVVSGRPASLDNVENMVGLFINTIPIRVQYDKQETLANLLSRMQADAIESLPHHYMNLAMVQSESELGMSLLDHVIVFENYPIQDVIENQFAEDSTKNASELLLKSVDVKEQINYNLGIIVTQSDTSINLDFNFNKNKHDANFIKKMLTHFRNLVSTFVANPNQLLDKVDYIKDAEKEELLNGLSLSKVTYPKESILDVYSSQVKEIPNSVQIKFEDTALTYQELDAKSNQLARYLIEKGVTSSSFVPLCVDRSIEMLVSILGILKTGASYVPIDPSFPPNRIAFILSDVNAKILLTQNRYSNLLLESENPVEQFCLDSQNDLLTSYSSSALNTKIASDQLAYVIYTSGTTGKPKGVKNNHGALLNRLYWMKEELNITREDTLLQKTPYTFDVSVWELLLPLLTGCKLIIAKPDGHKDPIYLENLIEQEQVDIMHFVPSMLRVFLEDVNAEKCKSLRSVICSGEALPYAVVNNFIDKLSGVLLYNYYGPTEAAIDVTSIELTSQDLSNELITIGRPVANTEILILSESLELLPKGATGEICIGGVQLAEGYLNRPDLTSSKFIEHPFRLEDKLYLTGDLGRWLPDGTIEYVGRKDHQVKIRGNRVELGEIETVLDQQEGVDQSVVVARKGGDDSMHLVAYLVSSVEIDSSELESILLSKLPEYMVPRLYITLEEMPLNKNGKVDRKALPNPDETAHKLKEYVAPESQTELKLVEIWEDVIGAEKIGLLDNFFDLGGHSLKAISLIGKYYKQFNKKVSIKEIFANPVLNQHIALLESSDEEKYIEIPNIEEQESYALSNSQTRLWLTSQFEEGSRAYNVTNAIVLDEDIDLACFQKAVNAVVERHEILRTVFKLNENDEVRQYILSVEDLKFEIDYKDYRNENDPESAMADFILLDSTKPFDLENGPLLRANLIQISNKQFVFYYNMHHIISDRWSLDVLANDVTQFYEGYTSDLSFEIPPLRIQYKDYASWQINSLDKIHEEYWLSQFEGDLPVLNLPLQKRRPQTKTHNGKSIGVHISADVTQKLRAFTKDKGGSLFTGLLTVCNVLLYRYTGETDLVVGNVAACRDHSDLQDQIGFYVNTLALRNKINPSHNFVEIFEQIKNTTLTAYEHQVYPFDKLIEKLDLHRNPSRSPLFDISLDYLGTTEAGFEFSNENELKNLGDTKVKFDIEFDFTEFNGGLDVRLNYNYDIYETEIIEHFLLHFKNMAEVLLLNSDTSINKVDYLLKAEKQRLLFEYNDTNAGYPEGKLVLDYIEEQVNKRPNNLAVICGKEKLTYKELDEKSTRVAYFLQKYGIKSEDMVPICVERSLEMIIGILGILKAGASYIPIDPTYPKNRVEYILFDTKVNVVLTQKKLSTVFENSDQKLIIIDINAALKSKKYNANDYQKVALNPEQPAYVMYTSGTSGKPKGVMISHYSLVDYTITCADYFDINENDKVIQQSSISFDTSIEEIFPILSSGGQLFIAKARNDFDGILNICEKEKITILSTHPYLVQYINENDSELDLSLRILISGGDVLKTSYVTNIFNKYSIYNTYGPTESTVCVSYHKVDEVKDNISIGSPIANRKLYIFGEDMSLQPVGIPGELCIGGTGLAISYLNQPKLTEEKFISHPLLEGEMLYKTGDLVRRLPNGDIEFIGRTDHQVKIRGQRIELGEIETTLNGIANVEKSVVVARDESTGSKHLVAYCVTKEKMDRVKIQKELEEKLPAHMVPKIIVSLEEMPLTSNGKIDRKALPAIDEEAYIRQEYVKPETPIEIELTNIWQKLLKIERVGLKDNFFQLGGNSLVAIKLIGQYNKAFDKKITVQDVFLNPEIKSHIDLIKTSIDEEFIEIKKVEIAESYPLSNSQMRLWLASQLENGSAAYNMPHSNILDGSYDVYCLEKAIRSVIERHEVLRTVFKINENGEVRQYILTSDELNFSIDFKDYRKLSNPEAAYKEYISKDSAQPFDLANGPLFRASLIRIFDEQYVLYYNLHHIVSDEWSMEVLLRDVLKYYDAFASGIETEFSSLRIQFKDYAAWQINQLKREEFQIHKNYWLTKFEDKPAVINLPVQKLRPQTKTYNGQRIGARLPAETISKLKKFTVSNGGSLFMGLLSAWKVLLYRYTGESDITIGNPVTGRNHPDLENQIGFYINVLALRTQINPESSFTSLYNQVKNNTLEAHQHQLYSFDKLVEDLDLQRDASRSHLFDILVDFHEGSGSGLDINEEGGFLDIGNMMVKFDIELHLTQVGDFVDLVLNFNVDVYERSLIEQLITHYKLLLEELVADVEKPIIKANYLLAEERENLLNKFNATTKAYPKEKTILDLFSDQVQKTPDSTALICGQNSLSYKELDTRSSQLANCLIDDYKINAGDFIGIHLNRSEEYVVSILGILKAGAVYVPVDIGYPTDRKKYIIEDCGVQLLLTDTSYMFDFDYYEGNLLALDVEFEASKHDSEIELKVLPKDLAYIIYTSGSTGNPKGVQVEHGNLNNYITWCNGYYLEEGLTNNDFGFFTSPSFDLTITSLFLPLTSGGKVNIYNDSLDNVEILTEYLSSEISCIKLTPSHVNLIGELELESSSLELVILGGEELKKTQIEILLKMNPSMRIYNEYGPTEATVGCVVHKVEDANAPIYIGKPIQNTDIYILDNAQQMVPYGVSGELYIGGKGVTRGYLNRPELTAEKFIESPFDKKERLYKTGDAGFWLENGNLYFQGRKDNQVKIQGYRIELGEIEAALNEIEKVQNSVVVVRKANSGLKQLVAYIVCENDIDQLVIKQTLSERLPVYMVPKIYVSINEMPLTKNGKIDRAALPVPNIKSYKKNSFVAPSTENEIKLAKAWKEVLSIEEVDIKDYFFELGGNSLLAIKLSFAITKIFKIKFEVNSIFKYPTIELQAQYLELIDSKNDEVDLENEETVYI